MSTTKSKNLDTPAMAVTLDWPRLVSIVLSIVGILVAGYLSWAEVTGNETVCTNQGAIDCSAVQNSAYADVFGLPVAVLGFLGYVAMLGILLLEDQVGFFATYGRTLVLCAALFGVLFQAYLTYVEAAVLEAWCQWCVISAITVTLICALAIYRVVQFMQPLRS